MHLSTRRRTPRSRTGFTLIELLLTMVILGAFTTAVTKLMLSQQRYVQRMSDQIAVRRELRRSMSMLPMELRGLSTVGGDLVTFSNASVTFRATFGSSFACAKPSSTTLDLPPVNTSRTTTTSWYTSPVAGDTAWVLRHDSLGTKGDFWSPHRITDIASSAAYCAASPYLDAGLDAGKLRYRLSVTPALPDSVSAGGAMRFTRQARFTLAQAASARWYLNRADYVNGSWTTEVPVAGPFTAAGVNGAGGFALAFFDSTGAAVTNPASAARVSRIDVRLRASGPTGSGPVYGTVTTIDDSVRFSVAVRNRR